MFVRNSQRFNIYAPQTIDGVTYPHFLDPLTRSSLGIEEIETPAPPEDFTYDTYYVTEQNEAPYVVYTRKSDEQIATMRQQQTNDASRRYLFDTDWMVTRFMENGTPIPDEVKAKRQEARDAIK